MVPVRRFLNDLSQVIEQAKVNQSVQLARGTVANMEQYNRRVGRIEGMDETIKIARDLLGQLEAGAGDAGDQLPEMPRTGTDDEPQPQGKPRRRKRNG